MSLSCPAESSPCARAARACKSSGGRRRLPIFPSLRLMISHGGGSVPYQIGRWQAEMLHPGLGGGPDTERFETALRRFWFDTVLHNPLSLELLLRTVSPDRVLFGTENPVAAVHPTPPPAATSTTSNRSSKASDSSPAPTGRPCSKTTPVRCFRD
jgi:hypothetical protein